jgi:hypothetical protein
VSCGLGFFFPCTSTLDDDIELVEEARGVEWSDDGLEETSVSVDETAATVFRPNRDSNEGCARYVKRAINLAAARPSTGGSSISYQPPLNLGSHRMLLLCVSDQAILHALVRAEVAIATMVRTYCGPMYAHSKASMPPMLPPITQATCLTPRWSRTCLCNLIACQLYILEQGSQGLPTSHRPGWMSRETAGHSSQAWDLR